jgi:hypothetical protein
MDEPKAATTQENVSAVLNSEAKWRMMRRLGELCHGLCKRLLQICLQVLERL